MLASILYLTIKHYWTLTFKAGQKRFSKVKQNLPISIAAVFNPKVAS